MTISLCMIVKDEEDCINRCLSSVSGVVDEIIIVDTGSTDETVFIAKEHGAKVSSFEWTGSFADARNESLSKATGDWVLILDADEELAPGMKHYLDQIMLLDPEHIAAYQFRIRNHHEDTFTEHYMPRFFRRNSGLVWSGYVHEQLVHKEDLYVDRPTVSQVVILHSGYMAEVIKAKGKSARNLALLNKSIEQEPENPFHWFNMGMVHYNQANWLAALDAFQTCLDKSDDRSFYVPVSCSCLIAAYMEIGKIEHAETVAMTAPESCFEYPDFLNNYGSLCYATGEYEEALAAYNKVISGDFENDMPFNNPSASTWRPYAGIGNVYLKLGDTRRAKKYFEVALEIQPTEPDLLRILEDINKTVSD